MPGETWFSLCSAGALIGHTVARVFVASCRKDCVLFEACDMEGYLDSTDS